MIDGRMNNWICGFIQTKLHVKTVKWNSEKHVYCHKPLATWFFNANSGVTY